MKNIKQITLTSPSDKELDVAVAKYVECLIGWKVKLLPWPTLVECPVQEATCLARGHVIFSYDGVIPNYSTSADEVVPLIERRLEWWKAEIDYTEGAPKWTVTYMDRGNYVYTSAKTFSRAACMALLKANGIQIIT